MPNVLGESKTPITSSKHKSVFLHEWWLIKVERGSKLGVGGFVIRETLGTRGMQLLGSASTGKRHNINTIEDRTQVYGSAAIVKRHDNNTVEAVDGIIIRISGCINKSRTLCNGFSPEVCDGFLSGFPYSWEDYAFKPSHDKCDNTTKQSLPVSFDDLPVTRVRDLLMSEPESRALTSIIFRDILKHTEKCLNQNVPSIEKISMNSAETEVDCKQDGDVSLSNPTQKITEEDYKIPVDAHLEKSEGADCKQDDDVSFSTPTQKITEEDHKIPVDAHMEKSEEADCKQDDDVSLSTPTQKITEEDHKIPVDSHSEKSEKAEGDGFMSGEIHKATQEKQPKARRYPLRSMQKRKNA